MFKELERIGKETQGQTKKKHNELVSATTQLTMKRC